MLLELINLFDDTAKSENYNGMSKLDVDRTHPVLIPIIASFCPANYEFARGNFFQHRHPYYPHVDGFADEINVLIPLRIEHPGQKFIVFDQTFPRPATWSINPNLEEFKINKLRRQAPSKDIEIMGLTNLTCPIVEHLPGNSSFWFSLSGTVHSWIEGIPIFFPSNRIHATGNQDGMKLGLTLIYKKCQN